MNILLTGSRAPAALDLLRRLSKAGHRVHLAESLRWGCGFLSRHASSRTVVPAPRHDPHGFIQAIARLIEDREIDRLIPTCEEVFFLARYRDQLPCPVFVDDFEKLDRFHNKFQFIQSLRDDSIGIPQTHQLTQPDDLQPFLANSQDWVFKPVYSRFGSEALIGPAAARLSRLVPTADRPWVAQQKLVGREVPSYSIAHQGRLVAHASYFSPYRVDHASGIYFRNWPNRQIQNFVSRLVQETHYTGQLAMDWIIDDQDRPWVIEANPRSTSGVHLFSQDQDLVGAFLDRPAADLIVGDRKTSPMVAVAMMSWGLKQAITRGPWQKFLPDLWRGRDVLFQWTDPGPALGMPLSLVELLMVRWRQRITLPEATTWDIQWDGQPLAD